MMADIHNASTTLSPSDDVTFSTSESAVAYNNAGVFTNMLFDDQIDHIPTTSTDLTKALPISTQPKISYLHDDNQCEPTTLRTMITLDDARLGITNAIVYLEANPDIAGIYVPVLKVVLQRLEGYAGELEDIHTKSALHTDHYSDDLNDNEIIEDDIEVKVNSTEICTVEPEEVKLNAMLFRHVKREQEDNNLEDSATHATVEIITDPHLSSVCDAIKNEQFLCSTCEKSFKCASKLQRHQCSRKNKKRYSNSASDKMPKKKSSLKQHTKKALEEKQDDVKVQDRESLICVTCNKCFPSSAKLERHQRVHTQHVCSMCDKTFSTKNGFSQHMKIHALEIGENPYTCSFCGKGFAQRGNLKIHERIHTGEKPYLCATCDKSFKSSGELWKHTVSVHGASHNKVFSCSFCEKSFYLSYNLKAHMRIHTGERPYMCSICGKTFRTAADYHSHLKIHTGEKPYSCTACDKSFISQTKLKRHIRCHTGERPYTCTTCGKGFTQSHGLRGHMRTHTGEKPYACLLCKKRCADSSNLKVHMRTHGINKPKKHGDTSTVSDDYCEPKIGIVSEEQVETQFVGFIPQL